MELDDKRESILKKIRIKEEEQQEILKQGEYLRYAWLLLIVTTPLGLIWGWGYCFWIASFWIFFISVGHYLNYFHLRGNRFEKGHLELDLEKLDKILKT